MPINADKPHLWKEDIRASVDFFNKWFMRFAPKAYRETRTKTTEHVEEALLHTRDLLDLSPIVLTNHPETLPTLRMCCCPPIARDRLSGLASVNKSLIGSMESGTIPPRMSELALLDNLNRICDILNRMLDIDMFHWLAAKERPSRKERHRASTIIADRLCGAMSDPIIRNAQEKRQLAIIAAYLKKNGYAQRALPSGKLLKEMEPGTFAFRMNIVVGVEHKVNIPVDVVIQPKSPRTTGLPIFIEAKSAGDFTNVNKRRKEEAAKMMQLKSTFGSNVEYILFLCGYFDSGYLGYEAAEGIDWIWEHRIEDFEQIGI